jgi:hypothetical protein
MTTNPIQAWRGAGGLVSFDRMYRTSQTENTPIP